MKKTIVSPSGVPTANLAINKSRIKLYNKIGSMPTYYLEKGQEFQIELFNPTSDTILAKIHLNGNAITQGGLVVRPGERVFLDRYIDVAKKFLFDTYSVNNTAEVRKAIEDNGDFKVQFYKESKPNNYLDYVQTIYPQYPSSDPWNGCYYNNSGSVPLQKPITTSSVTRSLTNNDSNISNNVASTCTGYLGLNNFKSSTKTYSSGDVSMDSLGFSDNQERPIKRLFAKKSKSIETGRVEMGSTSSQQLRTIDKTFDSWAFHTVEYKMLPISQKVNTSEDLNVKRYCSNCGAKHKLANKFCPSCGTKA